MSSKPIDVKPQAPPTTQAKAVEQMQAPTAQAPLANTAPPPSKVPVAPPAPPPTAKAETQPVQKQPVATGAAAAALPVGRFGGQQVPIIVPGAEKGPRLRGSDVHNVNARATALAWYVITEEVSQPSRYGAKGTCRECSWQCHTLTKLEAESLVKQHALQHLTAA
jgi:hypothetical protein